MGQESWNLQFPVTVTSNRRIQIPKSIFKAAKLKEGDTVILTLTQIYRKKKEGDNNGEQNP